MHLLTWRQVDFTSVFLAAMVAGYLMALAGLWAGRVPGLIAVDIADFGRRYIVSDRPSAWYFGLLSHLANSLLFTLAWAMAVVPNLSWPLPVSGVVFGEVLALLFAGGLIAPLAGMGILGRKTGSPRFAATSILLHALWGAVMGLLYLPPTTRP